MTPPRIRQVALVARDLDWATSALGAALGARVVYRDPAIVGSFGGLLNALLGIGGDCFLEVVAPLEASWAEGRGQGTTATRLLSRPGVDAAGAGYMLILQVDDVVATAEGLRAAGARPVAGHGMATERPLGALGPLSGFRYRAGEAFTASPAGRAAAGGGTGMCSLQWHPAEMGTLTETSQAEPRTSWHPAGNVWPAAMGGGVCGAGGFAGFTLAVQDPAAVAQRWVALGAAPLPPGPEGEVRVQLDGAEGRFVPTGAGAGRAGLVAVDLHCDGRPAFGEIELLGVRWRLVSSSSESRL